MHHGRTKRLYSGFQLHLNFRIPCGIHGSFRQEFPKATYPLAHALSHIKVLDRELEEDPAYRMYDRNTCSSSQELFLSSLVRWLNMRSPTTTGILGHASMGINTIRTRIPIPTITASQGGLYQPHRFHPLLVRCVRLQTLYTPTRFYSEPSVDPSFEIEVLKRADCELLASCQYCDSVVTCTE